MGSTAGRTIVAPYGKFHPESLLSLRGCWWFEFNQNLKKVSEISKSPLLRR